MKECTSKNPVNTTLKVLGGKWKPLILWYLNQKTLRFNELTKEIVGITQKMLTLQLRELEEDGLVSRKIYPEVPPKVEYSITEYGQTLEPVLDALAKWGKNHEDRDSVTSSQ
jgi:DNA-binding HxlR family transcriptional regulator